MLQPLDEKISEAFHTAAQNFSPYVSLPFLNDIIHDIQHCVTSGDAPCIYFNCFASGAFKEAYDDIPGLVFKFASVDNDTAAEIELLKAAHEAGLGDIFAPTYFVYLGDYSTVPCTIVAENNESSIWNEESETYDNYVDDTYANFIEIQPHVTPFYKSDKPDIYFNWDKIRDEKDYTVINDTPISNYLLANCSSNNVEWVTDFIKYYGVEKFARFIDFCEEYNVRDLHNNNIGYYKGRPIILDWLSEQPLRVSSLNLESVLCPSKRKEVSNIIYINPRGRAA